MYLKARSYSLTHRTRSDSPLEQSLWVSASDTTSVLLAILQLKGHGMCIIILVTPHRLSLPYRKKWCPCSFPKMFVPIKGYQMYTFKIDIVWKMTFLEPSAIQCAWCLYPKWACWRSPGTCHDILVVTSDVNLFLLLFCDRVSRFIEFTNKVTIPIWALRKHDSLFYGQEMNKMSIETR